MRSDDATTPSTRIAHTGREGVENEGAGVDEGAMRNETQLVRKLCACMRSVNAEKSAIAIELEVPKAKHKSIAPEVSAAPQFHLSWEGIWSKNE